MTRRHPQTANAPEARTVAPSGRLQAVCTLTDAPPWTTFDVTVLDGRRIVFELREVLDLATRKDRASELAALPPYGRGVPPGEPIHLTDEQIAEWRRE